MDIRRAMAGNQYRALIATVARDPSGAIDEALAGNLGKLLWGAKPSGFPGGKNDGKDTMFDVGGIHELLSLVQNLRRHQYMCISTSARDECRGNEGKPFARY